MKAIAIASACVRLPILIPTGTSHVCEGTACVDATGREQIHCQQTPMDTGCIHKYDAYAIASSNVVDLPVAGYLQFTGSGSDTCSGTGSCSLSVFDPIPYPFRHCHTGFGTSRVGVHTAQENVTAGCG